MKICLECGHICEAIPVLANDVNDESVDLELISDCCYMDIEEISDDRYEALRDLYELDDDVMLAELDDTDNLIVKAISDEVY